MGKTVYIEFPHQIQAKVIGVLTRRTLFDSEELQENHDF